MASIAVFSDGQLLVLVAGREVLNANPKPLYGGLSRVIAKDPGGFIYHVWNRAAGRLRLFKKDADYL
jgi:hypothetical protein